jgi:glycosyltransferase involved in cell wall biosynthesis
MTTANGRTNIGVDARFLLRPMRGMPRYLARLCGGLPLLRPDWQFTLFINRGFEYNEAPESYAPLLRRLEALPNVALVNHDDSGEMHWEQVVLPRLVRSATVDLLHMPGNRVCWLTTVPQVVTVHDTIEYTGLGRRLRAARPPERGWVRRRCFYVWVNYRLMARRATAVVTVSRHSAADVAQHLRVDNRKITTIYHGVEPAYHASSLPLGDRRFCLMLGGDSYQKNPENALAGWARVPAALRDRFPLLVAGFAGDQNSPLLAAIRRHGLEASVTVLGWVSDEELSRLFREAALLLYVSRYEGFGFPLLEAMVSGTPVVCSDTACMPEIAGDAGMYARPEDPDAISAGVRQLLADAIVWEEQRQRGIRRAADFSWESSFRQHLAVFESALNSPSRRLHASSRGSATSA